MFITINGARWGANRILREAEGVASGGGAEAAAPPPAEATGGKWFEDQRFSDDHRSYLSAKGLNSADDPMDAVQKLIGIGQAADRRFGRPLDSVIDRPAKDQALSDWRKANAELFGLPAAADGYEIKRPESIPEGVAWNSDLEARIKTLAFDRGIAPDDVQAMAETYAGYVAEVDAVIDADMKRAEQQLDAELGKLWGKDVDVQKTKARQAAGALAEAAGLDQAGVESVVGLLSKGEPGQTLALRLFATLGDMMGDDKAIGLKSGVGGLGMSKSEAQAALTQFMAPDGEFAKASAQGDTEAIARLRPTYDRLTRQVAAGK